MNRHLILLYFWGCLISCKSEKIKDSTAGGIQILLPDTTNNYFNEESYFIDIEHFSALAKQLGLNDMRKGADSFEIRHWYDFPRDYAEVLTILKPVDTAFLLSHYVIYTKPYDPKYTIHWNRLTHPIIDSVASKSVRISSDSLKNFQVAGLWTVRSESEFDTLKNIGSMCSSFMIEIADKRRYKLLRLDCPPGIIERIELKDNDSLRYYDSYINALTHRFDARVPYSRF